jgi:hypothetical protein
MPRTGSFSYDLHASADPAEVVALLSEFHRHRELHPLIVRVAPADAPPGVLRRYAITDRIPFGPFRLPLTYTADVLEAGPARVVTVARQRPGTTVRNDTRLTPLNGGLQIEAEITMTAPTSLFRFAFAQARMAHTVLAERLGQALGGRV